MTDIPANTSTQAVFEGTPELLATFSGELETLGDSDWVAVALQAGTTYQLFASVAAAAYSGGDALMTLHNASGGVIASDDNGSGSWNAFITFTPLVTATFFIEVTSALGGYPGNYSLAVASVAAVRFVGFPDNYAGDPAHGASDLIAMGAGADYVNLTGQGAHALGEQGDDFIMGDGGSNNLAGGLGNDTIMADAGDDRIFGDSGLDWLSGGGGNDFIYGGPGADLLDGYLGDDTIVGGEGVDRCEGGPGNDLYIVDGTEDAIVELDLEGFDAVSTTVSYILPAGQEIEALFATEEISTAPLDLTGNEFYNELVGNYGPNVLDGGAGFNVLRGYFGDDTYVLADRNDDVEDWGGTDLVISTITRTLETLDLGVIENPTLAGAADIDGIGNTLANTITGNDALNALHGGSGDDTLFGKAGSDTLDGADGDDTLIGGAQLDTLRGGVGNDTYVLENGFDAVVDGGGIDTVTSTISRSIASGGLAAIEKLTLVNVSTALNATGNGLANTLTGNNFRNTLSGGAGNDTLFGNANNDVLIGGLGRDTMFGGSGNDTFRFAARTQSPAAAPDIIRDFDDAGNDRIDLSALFGPKMSFIGDDAFTARGQVRIQDIAGPDVIVQVNTTGSLAADFAVRLTGTTLASMTASDFVL